MYRNVVLGVVALTLSCASDSPPTRAPSSASPGPVSCSSDADCHPPPCGPCASGTIITGEMLMQECVTNTCTGRYDDAGAFHDTPLTVMCSPSHVCTVR